MSRKIQAALIALFVLHLAWRIAIPQESFMRDVVLYNLIWAIAIIIILGAPLDFDRIALAATATALIFWGIGSLVTSMSEFSSNFNAPELFTQLSYTLFYPLLLIAIPRISSNSQRLNSLELLDSVIFGLGFTSILSTLLLTLIFPSNALFQSQDFFIVFYPVGDIALLLVSISQLIIRGVSRRKLLMLAGITAFAATDIYYLWLALHHRYSFGSIADDGWLIAIILIAKSTHMKSEKIGRVQPIHPALIAISIFISPILLALSALKPDIFPVYIVALLVANLLLAFIRMSTALRHARILNDERTLARTDELTGLANRRRLLAEIDNFSKIEGALMLLDLDGFKPINDKHGHEIGDRILREVAKRFNRTLPQGALLARLGGDEFGVLVRGSYEEALESANALRASVSYPFSIDGREISVGVSIGIVQNDGAGELLKRADAAMYRAKHLGMGVAQS
jgi:diguanylate cyclase (GGDEF)-like protein